MSETPDKIPESVLHAYTDGVLEEERRSEVEAYLAANPTEAQRVRTYQEQNELLRRFAQAHADDPIPESLTAQFRRHRISQVARAAVVAGWILLGAVGGWWSNELFLGTQKSGLILAEQAATAHRVFAPEVLHPVEVRADQQQHLVKWLSKRLGAKLFLPNLEGEGFTVVGGRLLSADTGPAAQFMYEDRQGARVTLYVRTEKGATRHTAFRFQERESVKIIYWLEGPVGFALSGELEKVQLLRVAEMLYEQLEKS